MHGQQLGEDKQSHSAVQRQHAVCAACCDATVEATPASQGFQQSQVLLPVNDSAQRACVRLACAGLTCIEPDFLDGDDGTGEGGDAAGCTGQAALDQLWVQLCHADACAVTLQGIALREALSQPALTSRVAEGQDSCQAGHLLHRGPAVHAALP